jgi:DNA polymerase-3 subunit epsilon
MKLKRPIVFFDLETTGLDVEKDRIVQFAAVRVHPDGDKSVMTFTVNPGIPIPKDASDVHGFTDDDVKSSPRFSELADEFYDFLQDADLAGYNIRAFDIQLLVNEFARYGKKLDLAGVIVLDVCEIFHKKEPRDLEGAVRFYLGQDAIFEKAHDALADTEATMAVLEAQIHLYGLPEEPKLIVGEVRDPNAVDLAGKLIKLEDGSVAVNFGKHKGTRLRDVPRDYLWWMLDKNVIGSDAKKIVHNAALGKI